MVERCDLRRLGRVDALVTVVVCLLLVLLVPVLLAKPREQSVRVLCAANLSQIGKTMFIYAADNEGILPRAGVQWTRWGMTANWMASGRGTAFGANASGIGGNATISSSFYLLVKYYQMSPRLFLCRADKGAAEFRLSTLVASLPMGFVLTDAWDFGPQHESFRHCSFSYHLPYNDFWLTTSRDPNLAIASDRNPFIKNSLGQDPEYMRIVSGLDPYPTAPGETHIGNAIVHGRDGQNVLFLDGRVTFETHAYCAVGEDDIFLITNHPYKGSTGGIAPDPWQGPGNQWDSVLVNDPNSFPPNPVTHRG